MACKVLCPSLPDLLRKTILTFCEGSVKFEHRLEVIGSLHIRSDNEKVVTFLVDELVSRPRSEVTGMDVAEDLSTKMTTNGGVASSATYQDNNNNNNNGTSQNSASGSFVVPKKSRKLSKPMRNLSYMYPEVLESSDAESEIDLTLETEQYTDSKQSEILNAKPLGMLERKMRDYLDNTDSNASLSSDETNRLSQQSMSVSSYQSMDMREASPPGIVSWEVTSTRPDDPVSGANQGSTPSESPTVHMNEDQVEKDQTKDSEHQEATPKANSPQDASQEEANPNEDAASPQGSSPAEVKMEHNPAIHYSSNNGIDYSSVYTVGHVLEPGLIDLRKRPAADFDEIAEKNQKLYEQQRDESEDWEMDDKSGILESNNNIEGGFPGPTKNGFGHKGQGSGGDSWYRNVHCLECGKALKSEKMLELHMNTAHTHKTIYPCKQCGKVFYAASSLHSHKKRTHTSWEQKLKCPYCPRSYAFQSELIRHMDLAHVELGRQHAASMVAQTFQPLLTFQTPYIDPVQLAAVVSSTQTPITTTQSDTSSSHSASPTEAHSRQLATEAHARQIIAETHSNAKQVVTVPSDSGLRFKCTECGMLLKSKECLALHMNAKHTQKQAYPCHVCGKVFYAPSSRFCHVRRVHASSEQKFKCTFCSKIFTFHYELRNHMKMMHRTKLASPYLPDSSDVQDPEDDRKDEDIKQEENMSESSLTSVS